MMHEVCVGLVRRGWHRAVSVHARLLRPDGWNERDPHTAYYTGAGHVDWSIRRRRSGVSAA